MSFISQRTFGGVIKEASLDSFDLLHFLKDHKRQILQLKKIARVLVQKGNLGRSGEVKADGLLR